MVNPQGSPGNARLKKRTENYLVVAVNPYNRNRAPTTTDYRDPATGRLYPIHTEWRDNTGNDIWKLVEIASNVATWFKMADGEGTSETACANYIVDPTKLKAEYATITLALAAASSGDTIFVKEGTYTEDLTLVAGVNLQAFGNWKENANNLVIIDGKMTASFNGQVAITGITLQNSGTNATDDVLEVTASTVSLNFFNSLIQSTNASPTQLIKMTDGIIWLFRSTIFGQHDLKPLTTTGGTFVLDQSRISWTGTQQSSTYASSTIVMLYSEVSGQGIASGTTVQRSSMCRHAAVDKPVYIDNGTSSQFNFCEIRSGTGTALTATGGDMTVQSCSLFSSNVAVIDGAGTLKYACLTFPGTSSDITTTTQTEIHVGPSIRCASTNIGGTNTVYALNEDTTNTASNARIRIGTQATAGDPYISWEVNPSSQYVLGTDNSDSDILKLTNGSTPSAGTELMTMTTAGAVNFLGPLSVGAGAIQFLAGSGSPNTVVTAPKGSLFMRTDGSSTSTRAYINTDSSTAWTNITTAA